MIERRLSVLVDANGSVEIVPARSDGTVAFRWLPVLALFVGLLVGSVLCLTALLGLLFTTSKTWQRPSCLQWMTLTALLDCIQGQMFGAAFITMSPADSFEDRPHVWCSLSAALSLALLLAQAGYLAALAIQVKSEPRKAVLLQLGCNTLPWLTGTAIAVSAFCSSPVYYFPYRNGCGFINNNINPWSTSTWQLHVIFILTTLGTSCLLTIYGIFCSFASSKQHENSTSHNTSASNLQTDKTVLKTLTLLFLCLVMPYGTLMMITTLSDNELQQHEHLLLSHYNNGFGFKLHERILTWMRYQFNHLLPIVILFYYKEVRQEGKASLFWFRKSNAIGCAARIGGSELASGGRRDDNNYVGDAKRTKLETPVLFSTSNGLHLRTVQSTRTNRSSICGSNNFVEVEKSGAICCELCDVCEWDSNSLCSSVSERENSRLQSRVNLATPDLASREHASASTLCTSATSQRRNVVRFAEQVIELTPAAESGVWSDPDEIAKRNAGDLATRSIKSSLGSTYTKLK